MLIANAIYNSEEFGLTDLKIYSSEEEIKEWKDNSDDATLHVTYEFDIADAVMKTAACNSLPVEFEFHNDRCVLLEYTYSIEERFYNQYRRNYVAERIDMEKVNKNEVPIIVYKGRCSCPRCYAEYGFDNIENICGIFKTKDSPHKKVEIDLQRSTRCRAFFMDKQSLDIYEKKYGQLEITTITPLQYMHRPAERNDSFYAPDSILSRHGYSTDKPQEVRRRILMFMMNNGIKKAEIKDKLTEFIEFRGYRCYMAAPIWREDLQFVNDYNIQSERQIEFGE